MFLSEIFEQLNYGELSQVSLGGDELGIQECDYAKVIPHVNLGLLELYKRFPIKISSSIITVDSSITEYTLHSDYAVSNVASLEPVKYITDTSANPFTDTILKIEKITKNEVIEDWEEQAELPINDENACWKIFTTNYKTFVIPDTTTEDSLIVHYRNSPVILDPHTSIPATTEILIPPSLLEPLLLYIANRIFSHMNTDQIQEGMSYYQKFEASCRKIEELSLMNRMEPNNIKLTANGWV